LLRIPEKGIEQPTVADISQQILAIDPDIPSYVLDAHIARGLGTIEYSPSTVIDDLGAFIKVIPFMY